MGIDKRGRTTLLRILYLFGFLSLCLVVYLAWDSAIDDPFTGARPTPSGPPPSIVLFVMDTTRFDAVSAYGHVAGTTPTTDALAADGLLYTRAYAQAPWTLPSHATLFTGLLPSQHGVGWHGTRARDSLVTLAERLRDAGYDSFGYSENGWVSNAMNMAQGFDGFVLGGLGPGRSLTEQISNWLDGRRSDRPFLLFVNVIDAHWPYGVRKQNPYLPPGVTTEQARSVSQFWGDYLCVEDSSTSNLAILEGLYHGDTAMADRKLGVLLQLLKKAGHTSDTVTIVTSDHGEHFGEHGLVSHQFSVREPLIHVPLIVHGVRGVMPAVIDEPVQLADIVPSVLQWASLPIPDGLPGRPLPTGTGERRPPRAIIAEYYDPERQDVADEGNNEASLLRRQTIGARATCTREWPVFGDMRVLIRHPFKLTWFERYPAELHNLVHDPAEDNDLATDRPDLVSDLVGELHQQIRDQGPEAIEGATVGPLPSEVRKSLQALGYLEDDARNVVP